MENGLSSTKAEGFLSRMALNDNKAGMEGLDRDKINKIIIESSKVNARTINTEHLFLGTCSLCQQKFSFLLNKLNIAALEGDNLICEVHFNCPALCESLLSSVLQYLNKSANVAFSITAVVYDSLLSLSFPVGFKVLRE